MGKSFSALDMSTFFSMMGTQLKQRRGDHYMCSCPFGSNHHSGVDKNASLSVIFGDPPGYKCFGCNESGTIRKLAKKWLESTGDSRPLTFLRSFDDKSTFGERAKAMGSYADERAKRIGKMARRGMKTKEPINEERLKAFMRDVPEYAFEIGLTKRQILDWEIGYDESQDRMIIPVRDKHGKLFGVSGRDLSGASKIKYRHYTGLNKESVLYGEKFINIRSPNAYIVEGFSDVWGLQRQGLGNVFATMGTSISTVQEQTLTRWFRQVVFVPDGDVAGLKFAIEYGHKLLFKIPKIGIAGVTPNKNYVKREKPAKWEASDYKYNFIKEMDGKDPDELSSDELNIVLNSTQWLDFF